MTTKKMIGIAAVGLILYELWKREQVAAGPSESIYTDNNSPIPAWGQQLSQITGTTTETSIISDLMSVPQGPGGLPNVGGGAGYFATPECILPPM